MIDLFVFSLNIPAMITISCKMIKIVDEKMFNVTAFYWFHNDTLAENNSLNGHSNEP